MYLKKTYRVKKEVDFQRVFHHGKSKANRQLVVYTYPKPGQPHFRVGFSVGKKIGNAVERNQIKRYLRQAVTELKDQLPNELDFIIIARADIKGRSFHEVKQSLVHVLKLADII